MFGRALALIAIATCVITSAQATNQIHYYGEEFYFQLSNTPEDVLKRQLQRILSKAHLIVQNDFDKIYDRCPNGKRCTQQQMLGYKHAREILFGAVHLERTGRNYKIKDAYCGNEYTSANLPGLGPLQIPDHRVINAEHTWPQSKFNPNIDRETQKSDLTGLYPVMSQANSSRQNIPFGEVDIVDSRPCAKAARGRIRGQGNQPYFEPPAAHKGNVARAMFYFSIRYGMPIDSVQEGFLRDWHEQDPVDRDELERNQAIFEYQENRNPFIDHPELIYDFQDL